MIIIYLIKINNLVSIKKDVNYLNGLFTKRILSKPEFAFLSIIFMFSFLPFYRTRNILNITQLSFIIFLLVAILLTIICITKKIYKEKNSIDTVFFVFSAMLILGIFNTIVINKKSLEIDNWLTLSVIFLSMYIPYLFAKVIRNTGVPSRRILSFTAITITLASFIIFLYKYIILKDWTERFSTSLGGAAVVHIVFLLTSIIFFALVKTEQNIKAKVIYIILLCISALLLFSTESRAGFISSILFILIFLLLTLKNSIKKEITKKNIFALAGILIICTVIFLNLADTRLFNLKSVGRSVGYLNSIELSFQEPKTFLFGYGYATIWDWYGVESGDVHYPYKGSSLYLTDYGLLLYHSHSTFLEILVEFGFFNLVLFLMIIFIILKSLINSYMQKWVFETIILLGLLSSISCFALDLYLFKNWFISFIWWSILFFALPDNQKNPTEA